ncbi:MAG: hypothetical protein FJY10_07700 [Bacteroidetes bacterium]|nr:hypothetical protein [Bacteroidota bacterium]
MKKWTLFLSIALLASVSVAQWVPVGTGLGNFPPTAMFTFVDTIYLGTEGGGVYRTLDNGSNWVNINGNLGNLEVNDIRPGPASTIIFVATASGPFYTNDLANYDDCSSTGLTNTDITYFWFGGDDAAEWAIGTAGGGVFVSSDYFGPWTAANSGISGNGLLVNDMGGYSDSGTDYAVMASDGGTYYSTDNLTTWTQKNNGLTGDALLVKKLTGLGGLVLIATRDGLFMSSNNGDTWTELIPNEKLNTVLIVQTPISPTGFYVFAFGENGFYSEDLVDFFPVDLTGLPAGEITCVTTNSTYMFLGITTTKSDGGGIYRKPLDMVVSYDEMAPTDKENLTRLRSFPNPFSHKTEIQYYLDTPGQVVLSVYSSDGQLVKTPVNGFQEIGFYSIPFCEEFTAGRFFYTILKINDRIGGTGKMIRVE